MYDCGRHNIICDLFPTELSSILVLSQVMLCQLFSLALSHCFDNFNDLGAQKRYTARHAAM